MCQRRRIISSGVLNSNKFLNKLNMSCPYSRPWANQDRTRPILLHSPWELSFVESLSKYLGSLEGNLWCPGVRDRKDLTPVTSQLEKRSWKFMKGFKLPQKLWAPKHSSSWHLDCQYWTWCSEEKTLPRIMPLMPHRIRASLIAQQVQNPSHQGVLEIIMTWPKARNFRLLSL